MDALIHLCETDLELLAETFSDGFSDSLAYQLQTKPALPGFRLEIKHKNGTLSQYTFCHENKVREIPLQDGTSMTSLPGISVLGAVRCFDCDNVLLVKSFFASMFDEKMNPCMATPVNGYLHPSQPQGIEELKEYADFGMNLYYKIQYLLLHHEDCLSFSIKSEPSKHSAKMKKNGKKKYSPPKKVRTYHLVGITPDVVEHIRRNTKNHRHCLAWAVRGHFRHCKSGKVVYVQPHVKGKEKQQYQGREYVLLPNIKKNQ